MDGKLLIGFEQSDQTEFSAEQVFNYVEYKMITWKTEFYVMQHFKGYAMIAETKIKKEL